MPTQRHQPRPRPQACGTWKATPWGQTAQSSLGVRRSCTVAGGSNIYTYINKDIKIYTWTYMRMKVSRKRYEKCCGYIENVNTQQHGLQNNALPVRPENNKNNMEKHKTSWLAIYTPNFRYALIFEETEKEQWSWTLSVWRRQTPIWFADRVSGARQNLIRWKDREIIKRGDDWSWNKVLMMRLG